LKRKYVIVLAAALVLVIGGAGFAKAVGGDDEQSVTGPQADQAVAAALAITGGGTANTVERDSEDGATWEVEVTKPDGRTVDVRLDANFKLVKVEGDSEQEDGADSEGGE
jgi:Peptidase propeptide and YPEB domain